MQDAFQCIGKRKSRFPRHYADHISGMAAKGSRLHGHEIGFLKPGIVEKPVEFFAKIFWAERYSN